MSWISSLYETYDNNSFAIGKRDNDETVLLPIAHSTQNAQLEISIDKDGNFIRAKKVEKSDAVTVIPVTEDSCSRGNGVFPHPLCDKLVYVAGDYEKYCSKANSLKSYEEYIKQLEGWSKSSFSHEKAAAVFKYLIKRTTVKDLVEEKLLKLDSNGKLNDDIKIEGVSQEDVFVRFIVQKRGENDGAVWKDNSLYDSFINYYIYNIENKDICYVTGKNLLCSDKHPSKIRNSGDKSKLLSSNDTSGFTYMGRFTNSKQAYSIGYIPSQKAHNALRWLIQKQGYKRDDSAIIAWAVNGARIPDPLENTNEMFYEEIGEEVDTAASYALRLNRAISGYSSDLNTATKIVVMSFDAATTGRLSITYYKEINGSEFLDRILNWHLHCSWKHQYSKNKGRYSFIGAPSPREIALASFGVEQNNKLTANEKLIKSTVERLLPCIIDGRMIPYDIVNASFHNAVRSTHMFIDNWNNILTTTCAIVKKHRYEKYKEEYDMALNFECNDRSYLFGRLLAVADRVEYLTYENGEKRETNAKRYMNVFTKRPAKAWEIIYKNLLPYLNKLKPGQKIKYDNMISEIGAMLDEQMYKNDSLSELFLLGYYCQSDYMKNKKEKSDIKVEMEDEDYE